MQGDAASSPIRPWGAHAPVRPPALRRRAIAPMLALTALVAGLTLALAGTAVASTGNCYSREGCTEGARSAKDFIASAGINTHLGYSQTAYWRDWPMIRDRLLELGV